jgi:hypothetical protein
MRVRYTTMNLPANGMGAFMPTLSQTGTGSTGGLRKLAFYPGTVKVPSPAPGFVSPSGKTGNSTVQNSHAGAPDWFLPAIGIPYADNMHAPVPTSCDNVLPVPIPHIRRIPQQQSYQVRHGGRTATAWPQPMTRWPTYGGGTA